MLKSASSFPKYEVKIKKEKKTKKRRFLRRKFKRKVSKK